MIFGNKQKKLEAPQDNRNSFDRDRQLTIAFDLEIPERYYRCPIIANLTAYFDLEVNILAAFLGKATERKGWFDLELRGTIAQIESALIYLKAIDLKLQNLQIYNCNR